MNQAQGYICTLSLKPLSHLPPHQIPLSYDRAPDLNSLHHTVKVHWLPNFTYGDVCFNSTLSIHPISPLFVYKSVVCVCISTAALQIGSLVSTIFLGFIYMC